MPQANRAYITSKRPTPRYPRALTPGQRKLIDDAMSAHWRALEGLIAFLDAADGDADLEDDDREQDHDGREPDDERWFVPAVGGF